MRGSASVERQTPVAVLPTKLPVIVLTTPPFWPAAALWKCARMIALDRSSTVMS